MSTALCPTCKQPLPEDSGKALFPFCSQRCKSVDLHGWLAGRYVVSRSLLPDDGEALEALAAANEDRGSE